MKRAQKKRLEQAGWKIGTASELLGMTEAEEALVEAKLRLGDAVRTLRVESHLSQAGLAKLMGSSQPRVAKLENRDPEVSLDLQMKAVFAASAEARREFQGLVKRGPAFGGVALLWSEGRGALLMGEWVLHFAALTVLAVIGALGFRRVWLAGIRAQEERADALARLADSERKRAQVERLAAPTRPIAAHDGASRE
jgi:transcriptional regulator with XRE-family HTH domain